MNQDRQPHANLKDLWKDEKPKEFTALDGRNRKARRAQKSLDRKRLAKAA